MAPKAVKNEGMLLLGRKLFVHSFVNRRGFVKKRKVIMNVCFFEGFVVGKKPMKMSARGKEVLPFGLSILVNPQATNPKEKSTILNCVAFDRTARSIDDATNEGANYLHLQTTQRVNCYTDKNGYEHVNPVYWVSSATCHRVSTNKSTNGLGNEYVAKQQPPPNPPENAVSEDGMEDFV
jgi:hypothetical protein